MFASIGILCFLLTVQLTVQQELRADKSVQFLQNCFLENLFGNEDIPKLYKSEQLFAINLIKNVYAQNPGKNIFLSPYSIHQALLLALFVSTNHTEHNIKQALHFPSSVSKAKIIQAFKMRNEFQKLRFMDITDSCEFNSANRLFVSKDLTIRDCMQQLFNDEIYPVDYKNLDSAIQLINQWVSDKTKNQINDFLSQDDVTEDIKLILANAAYFKGLWKSKFNPENTSKETFYISLSKNTPVPMMHQKGTFKYLASLRLEAHVLQLPYKGGDISMFILLPPLLAKPNGMANMLSKLDGEVLSELGKPGYMMEHPLDISIPKFEVEQEIQLVQILESLGVGDLFQETANLSALTGKQDINFSDAKHKAKICVDEDGTVAAASTGFFSFRSSLPDYITFICDHPFLYFIFDNITQSILFIGVYNSPV